MNYIYRLVLLLSFLLSANMLYAQPANDDCSNAEEIVINFSTGIFTTTSVDLTDATKIINETIHPVHQTSGTDKKTVWFKFSIPTARGIRVDLKQPGTAIAEDGAGFTVFKSSTCMPLIDDVIPAKITPLNKFGNSYNPCLAPGDYFIQVSSKADANDLIFIELEVSQPNILNNYDKFIASDVYNFGTVSPTWKSVTYDVGCQTIDDATEISSSVIGADYLDYTQTSWHVFTTDSHIDLLRMEMGESSAAFSGTFKAGVKIYEGDVRSTPIAGLILKEDNELFEQTTTSYVGKNYTCSFEASKTYSIQIFFHKDYVNTFNLRLYELGTAATNAPAPAAITATSNDIGVLTASASGVWTNRTEWLACNSYIADNLCGTVNPVSGDVSGYKLSTWYRFELSASSNVQFNSSNYTLKRIFVGDAGADCDATLFQSFTSTSQKISCMPAGVYSIQILGKVNLSGAYILNEYYSKLARPANLSINVQSIFQLNEFSLSAAGKADEINTVAGTQEGLPHNVKIYSTTDKFGCLATVLPDAGVCAGDRAIYRTFIIEDFGTLRVGGGNNRFKYGLYRGDAEALATAQGTFLSGETFTGLTTFACFSIPYPYYSVCVTPGTYTLISFGDAADVAEADTPWLLFLNENLTDYVNPDPPYTAPEAPEDLGDITASLSGGVSGTSTNWCCIDNPLTIDGKTPCYGYTKQVYRQFYIADAKYLKFSFTNYSRIFYGKITDGIGTLTAIIPGYGDLGCRRYYTADINPCNPRTFPAGWYTIVSYANGGDYDGGNFVSNTSATNITISEVFPRILPTPNFNKPSLASQAGLLDWGPNTGTSAYPITDRIYNLQTEYYNCNNDLAFPTFLNVCESGFNRVTYYTFELARESFVSVFNIPSSQKAVIHNLDIKTSDSLLFATDTPIQPCIQETSYWAEYATWAGRTDICRMQPGIYTIIVYANDSHIGSSLSPQLYVEKVEDSRFDHASTAYDFDDIPGNGTWYDGKVGDINPLDAGRAASNDFFSCKTGAQPTDPEGACWEGAYPISGQATVPYPMPENYNFFSDLTGNRSNKSIRRNLWYTFTVTGPGRVTVEVLDKTSTKHSGTYTQSPWIVMHSTTNALLDSTYDQSLVTVRGSAKLDIWGRCVGNYSSQNFYIEPCDAPETRRYYVLVDHNAPHVINPNNQVEVRVKFEQESPITVVYDFYSEANRINGLNEIAAPYTDVALTDGTYTGPESRFPCATKDITDQNTCGETTLWYAFDVAMTGKLRINYDIIDGLNTSTYYNGNEIQLYREIIPGDPSEDGLERVSLTSRTISGIPWGESCMNTGRYYIMLTGCSYDFQHIIPRVQIVGTTGDLCSAPAILPSLTAEGSTTVSVAVDCHTIGEAFGEDGSNMNCLFGPEGYKSTWFKVNIDIATKVDLTFRLGENTSAFPHQIRYRIMYGQCDYMTAGPCNTNALTEFTLNCMKTEGTDYFIQVVTPDWTTGDLSLTVETTPSINQTCVPFDPDAPVANFSVDNYCLGEEVSFLNYSTQGAAMSYLWDFGTGNAADISTDFSPVFTYPNSTTEQNYTVSLTVTNTALGISSTVDIPITLYPLTTVAITRDAPYDSPNLVGMAVDINYHSSPVNDIVGPPATTYVWDLGNGITSASQDPILQYGIPDIGIHPISIETTNGYCVFTARDTIVIGYEEIYAGGPYDGTNMITLNEGDCPTFSIFDGGAYDGANMITLNEGDCPTFSIFDGGAYDGTDMQTLNEGDCPTFSIFDGGAYDGTDMQTLNEGDCPTFSIFDGGPYDGTDMVTTGEVEIPTGNAGVIYICVGDEITIDANGPAPLEWYEFNTVTSTWDLISTEASITVQPDVTTDYKVITPLCGAASPANEDVVTVLVTDVLANVAISVADTCFTVNIAKQFTTITGIADETPYTLEFLWDFGDGNTSTDRDPFYTFTTIGDKPVSLTVNIPGSCSRTVTQIIHSVGTILNSKDTICAGSSITLTADSDVPPPYEWFIVGNPVAFDTNNSVIVTPATDTDYRLEGTDACAVPFVEVFEITVIDNPPVTFTVSPACLLTDTEIQFDETTGTNPADPYNFAWNLGDGGTSSERDTVYSYPNTGNQTITLTVDYNGWCSASHQEIITINQDVIALDYRTKANGDWTDINIWEIFDAGSATWMDASSFVSCTAVSYPTSASKTVYVQHDVLYDFTIPVGIDETEIAATGILTVPAGIDLQMVDVSASTITADIENNGRINIAGTFTAVAGALLVNDPTSTVAYTNAAQTMWDGIYGNLEISGTGIKTVSGNNTSVVTDVNFIDGYIQLNNRNMSLGENCTVTNADFGVGFFITNLFGSLVRENLGASGNETFEFPVGFSIADFNKAVVTNSGVADNIYMRANNIFSFDNTISNDELIEPSSVNRTWFMSEDTNGGSDITLAVYWITANENIDFDNTDCHLGEFNPITGWERIGVNGAATGSGTYADMYTHYSAGITVLDAFSVGSCMYPVLRYRTIADGDWTDITIWEVENSSGDWVDPITFANACGLVPYPSSYSLDIDVRHQVQFDYSIPQGVDELTVRAGATVTIPSGNTFILKNGTGTDLLNLGTIVVTGDITRDGTGSSIDNQPASIFHYNGGAQTIIEADYAILKVEGSLADAATIKVLESSNTSAYEEVEFINAKIDLNFNMTVGADAVITNPSQTNGYFIATGSSFLIREFNAGLLEERLFPVGGTYYSPANLTFDNATAPGTMKCNVTEAYHPNLSVDAIQRYWTFEQGTVAFSGEYNLDLTYSIYDLASIPANTTEEFEMVKVAGAYNPAYLTTENWYFSDPIIVTDKTIGYAALSGIQTGTITHDEFAGSSDFTLTNTSSVCEPFYDLAVSDLICTDGSYTFPDGTVVNNITTQQVHTSYLSTTNDGCDSTITITVDVYSPALSDNAMYGEYQISPASLQFPNFQSAIDSLVLYGVKSDVIFRTVNETYTEQLELGTICGVQNVATVTFTSNCNDCERPKIEFNAEAAAENFVLKISNAKYITFSHIDFEALGSSKARIVELDTCNNINFTDCIFQGDATTNDNSNERTLIYSPQDPLLTDITFSDNIFRNGSYAVQMESTGTVIQNVKIETSYFTNQAAGFIKFTNHTSPVIQNNITETTSSANTFESISLTDIIGPAIIQNNTVYSSANGISLTLNNVTGDAGTKSLIANNMFGIGSGGSTTSAGLDILGTSSFSKIYHNSFNVNSTSGNALNINNLDNADIRNNIFATGGGSSAIVSGLTNTVINYNAYSPAYASKGANSINQNPGFTSASDLHTEVSALQAGDLIAEITLDIDDEPRQTPPYMGADEFLGSVNWEGDESNDWSTAGNWNPAVVPTRGTTVDISDVSPNFFPETNSSSDRLAEVRNISIQSGAHLNIAPKHYFTVYSSFVNHGEFVIKSDVSGTGSFIPLGTPGLITGTGTSKVEQYISGGNWHYVSSPVSAASDIYSGDFYWWDETVKDRWLENDYVDWVTGRGIDYPMGWTPATGVMQIGEGYANYSASTKQVVAEGVLNNGNYTVNLDFTDQNGDAVQDIFDGWNLLGNPYPSTINWNSDGIEMTNVDNAIYVYNDNGTGVYNNYDYYMRGVPGSPYPLISLNASTDSCQIAPNQSVFVRANSTGANIKITNKARRHKAIDFYKTKRIHPDLMILSVEINKLTDETAIRFIPDATETFDGEYDAIKRYPSRGQIPQLSSVTSVSELAINTLTEIRDDLVVPLNLRIYNEGNCTFTAKEFNFDDNVKAYLLDSSNDSISDINTGFTYTTTLAAGKYTERFYVLFSKSALPEDSLQENYTGTESVEIFAYKDIVTVLIKGGDSENNSVLIYDILGKNVISAKLTSDKTEIPMSRFAAGNYIVKVMTENGVYKQKIFIE